MASVTFVAIELRPFRLGISGRQYSLLFGHDCSKEMVLLALPSLDRISCHERLGVSAVDRILHAIVRSCIAWRVEATRLTDHDT